MSLFLKPLSSVTFSDVQTFCGAYLEGIRVEYKETPVNIAKVVSSFANTSGGIWVIGAKEDPATRTGQLTGLPKGPGYTEQIVQSCLTGVYPPLKPSVMEFPLEGAKDKVVVVVKMEESTEAPHAIENSTRAYLRVANVSQPYELADMDRLEYLFKRRQSAESKRESLIETAREHCTLVGSPRIQVVICPTFPYQPIKSLDDIDQFVEERRFDSSHTNQAFYGQMRKIQDGMLNRSLHLELNKHGLILLDQPVEIGQRPNRKQDGMQTYMRTLDPVLAIGRALSIAQEFISDTVLNLLIRVTLLECHGIFLQYHQERFTDEMPGADHTCYGSNVHAETRTTLEGLNDSMTQTVTELMTQVFWSFNRTTDGLKERVTELLLKDRLL